MPLSAAEFMAAVASALNDPDWYSHVPVAEEHGVENLKHEGTMLQVTLHDGTRYLLTCVRDHR